MLRGHRRRQAAVRPPRRARFGAAAEWASVRRRRRGWVSRMPAVVVRPRPSAEPVSVAERDYFRRPAFHVRVGAVGLVATTLFAILFLRLWSLEMIQGRQFAHAARAQAFPTVHFPTARGPILDRSDRLLAGTSGAVVVSADPATLGTLDPHGRWTPSPTGRARVRHLAWVARVPNRRLLADIRRSVRRSPFAPAVVIPRPSAALASYLDERARDLRGFQVTVLPTSSYPRGALGGA